MTDNDIIYQIHQDKKIETIWNSLTIPARREALSSIKEIGLSDKGIDQTWARRICEDVKGN